MNKDEIIAKQAAYIATLEEQLGAVEALKTGLAQALDRIAELEARLKSNSSNSSRPPSSDGLKKKPAFPRKKGGKRGGKSGHKGNTLKFTDQIDHRQVHKSSNQTCNCGCDFSQVEAQILEEKRQVFDLPPRLLEVTEHRIAVQSCPACGSKYKGSFPDTVKAPVQYGNKVRALVSLLSVEQSMPVGRISELFNCLTGYKLNENTIVSGLSRMAEDLKDATAFIKEKVLEASVAHADETGVRVAGKLHWTHDLVTDMFTYFFVHPKRGREALESEDSITLAYQGILIHDCWFTYFGLSCSDHGLCGAHLLRELAGLKENHNRKWAAKMHDLLMYAYQFSEQGKGILCAKKLKVVKQKYTRILAQADEEEPPPIYNSRGRPKKTKGRNLFDRMKKYEDQVLNFTKLANVPFTNNLAERDIRPWKTKLKVSGCFRTLEGAKIYATIKGFCSTARKHGLSAYEQLVNVIEGEPFLKTSSIPK